MVIYHDLRLIMRLPTATPRRIRGSLVGSDQAEKRCLVHLEGRVKHIYFLRIPFFVRPTAIRADAREVNQSKRWNTA